MTKNTCLYTWTLESEDDTEKQIIFEIYHGGNHTKEHEIVAVNYLPKDVSLVDLICAAEEYASFYDVATPSESWLEEQYNKLNNPQ